jgi:hypothetical protein
MERDWLNEPPKDWLDNLIEGAKLIGSSIECDYLKVIDGLQCRDLLGEEVCDLITYNMKEHDIHVTREQLKHYELY